jgi:hypothetical protein
MMISLKNRKQGITYISCGIIKLLTTLRVYMSVIFDINSVQRLVGKVGNNFCPLTLDTITFQ